MKNTIEPPSRQEHQELKNYIFERKAVSVRDVLWLVVLTVYIMVGIVSVPFHGDEAMQITMSRDYFTAFVNHQPQALLVTPPYPVDSPNVLRLINGSINLYTVGLSLQVAGYNEQDLPSLWQWPLSYDENTVRGSRPEQRMLVISRVSSALFLAISAAVLFGIGWQLGGRWAGYIASGLYALNPVILLNGRRAMMEGSVLCFGLLTIFLAILICRGRNGWRWWVLMGIAGGLTLTSKHSGIVYVAVTLGWVVIREIQKQIEPPSRQEFLPQRRRENRAFQNSIRIVFSLIITAILFILLSPAQWNNPVARFGDLINQRAELLESQVKAEPSAPTTLSERVMGIVTQPYMQAPVYFEVGFWAGAAPVQAEIAQYDGSVVSGLRAGMVIGGILTILAAIGILISVQNWRTWKIGVLVWLAVIVASLLVNPLPWQRYYLALYPLAAVLTAVGTGAIIEWIQRRSSA